MFHYVLFVTTWAERRVPPWCTWTFTSLQHGCRPKFEQRALSDPWTPPMLSFQTAPSLSWCISTDGPKERKDSNQHTLATWLNEKYFILAVLSGCFWFVQQWAQLCWASKNVKIWSPTCVDAIVTTWDCDGVKSFKFHLQKLTAFYRSCDLLESCKTWGITAMTGRWTHDSLVISCACT